MVADAEQIVHTYEVCQFYARQTHMPVQALQMIPITWPFAVWGLNMTGPLKKVPRGYTHLLVAVDKFTKWIEARPIMTIKSMQAVTFFLDIVQCFWGAELHHQGQWHAILQARSSWSSVTTTTSELIGLQ